MNSEDVRTRERLEALLEELTDRKRPISYNLSEIMVIDQRPFGWLVIWRQDGSR